MNKYIFLSILGCSGCFTKVTTPQNSDELKTSSHSKSDVSTSNPIASESSATKANAAPKSFPNTVAGDGYEATLIPSGSFTMGCTSEQGADCRDSEKPSHQVTLSRSFYLLKHEVTQELYEKVMGENPSYFKGSQRPVEEVSWYAAVRFANKLSELEGREECYQIGGGEEPSVGWSNKSCRGWRLPTESEWEYAARGNADYKYAGSNTLDEVGWYDDNSGDETHPVGQKKANGFGLYDMSGNVWEWVWDRYGEYDGSPKTDPVGGVESSFRVLRGGSWRNRALFARASYRDRYLPSDRSNRSIGFRVLRVTE